MNDIEKDEFYKIELPAPWKIEIKEEVASIDGRVFLGDEFSGAYTLWTVEPRIELEAKPRKDYSLYLICKIKGEDKGVSRALSNGRVTIGNEHAHKKVLLHIFKKDLTPVEISILEQVASMD